MPREDSLEIFVISDLHIGGAYPAKAKASDGGFRMNTRVGLLVEFVNEVGRRHRATGRRTELVINGDFVDFLAEKTPDNRHHAFIEDEAQAVAVFNAILLRDKAFFDALAVLMRGAVALTVILGNHDVELSLPAVRRRLEEALGVQGTAGGLFKFIYDGEAYVVGDVLIEHGNRYDEWNVVDHDRLRRLRSEMSRRLDVSEAARFVPPSGSALVERVMNPIKRDYPFIDLLKPETGAALPLLLALEPSLAGAVETIEAIRRQRQAARHRQTSPGRPGQPGDIAGNAPQRPALGGLSEMLATRLDANATAEAITLVNEASAAKRESRGDIAAGDVRRVLSFIGLRASPSYAGRLKILLAALRALRGEKSFVRNEEGEKSYIEAAEQLAQGGFSAIVFGHTHLAKQVPLRTARGTYLNTGTWADLMKVPAEIIEAPSWVAEAELERFAKAIRDRDMDALITHCPTYAHLEIDTRGRASTATVEDYKPGQLETL